MELILDMKNIKCLWIFSLILSLFLPIAYDDIVSMSILDFSVGKIIAILLLATYFICLQNIKSIFLKVLHSLSMGLLLFSIIEIGINSNFILNISTVSLILILIVLLCVILFKRK